MSRNLIDLHVIPNFLVATLLQRHYICCWKETEILHTWYSATYMMLECATTLHIQCLTCGYDNCWSTSNILYKCDIIYTNSKQLVIIHVMLITQYYIQLTNCIAAKQFSCLSSPADFVIQTLHSRSNYNMICKILTRKPKGTSISLCQYSVKTCKQFTCFKQHQSCLSMAAMPQGNWGITSDQLES